MITQGDATFENLDELAFISCYIAMLLHNANSPEDRQQNRTVMNDLDIVLSSNLDSINFTNLIDLYYILVVTKQDVQTVDSRMTDLLLQYSNTEIG